MVTRKYIRKSLAQLPFLIRALGFVWDAAGAWTIAWVLLLIVQGLLPVANVYLTRFLVNQLVAATSTGLTWESVRSVLLPVFLIALVMMLTAILSSLSSWIRIAQSEKVQDYMSSLIHQKSSEVDLAFYDSPDFYDHLHRARTDATYRPVALLNSVGSLIQNGVTMVSMALVLVQFGWWVPVALIISTLPVFYVVLRYRQLYYLWRIHNTATERKSWYFDWLLTERQAAAEMRLFQLSDLFSRRFQDLRQVLRQERIGLARKQAVAELAASLGSLLVTAISMIWMLVQTIAGKYNLGDMAFFYQAFIQGQGLARSFLENVGEIYSNSLFLGDLFEFLSLEPKVTDPPQSIPLTSELQQGICFTNVSFYYPGSTRPALKDFNLQVPAGQFVAIVGPNGAGKSTLIRLLCRFYDPQTGTIKLDGTELKQFSVKELRRIITVLFQEPVQYNTTASENIALGDIGSNGFDPKLAEDPEAEAGQRKRVKIAAIAAGADEPISHLPEGYDSLLGKWFDGGTDLSVGEWQRLALARAFLRQAGIIILDEPTSAMDPWAEADWLARFHNVAKGKTTILITHRFTTAAHADVIHVMQDGCIIESGRHTDLLAAQGLYAKSWKTQMRSWSNAPTELNRVE
ncbi:MAG: Xenobiotic-transporting ATPase [Chloroflexi bacterium]|nr:Xenobiotic-transporting ATPase [Chloroflexota bacterium]